MKLSIYEHKLHIEIEESGSVDSLLIHFFQSKKNRYLLYQSGAISVDDVILKKNQMLHFGNHLSISLQSEKKDDFKMNKVPLNIGYEDELFLIVNKPVHKLVHPDGVNTSTTLANDVKAYFIQSKQDCPVRAIHRLDMDTTGLVMFCKIPFFQPMLDHMLSVKMIYREYDAIVDGTITQKQIQIDTLLSRDRHNAKKMRVSTTGKEAHTTVYVQKTWKDKTWVHCILHTGRTHQIRVHLASLAHPILSDYLYGSPSKDIARLALHASKLCFYHPLLQKEICVTCELPEDMKNLLL